MLKGKGLLTPIQRHFLTLFAGVPDQERFYLTGGTALTEFCFGHRLSYDLDLFTSEAELVGPFARALEAAAAAAGFGVQVPRRFATYVELLVAQGDETLRVDLALDSPFRFEPPVLCECRVHVNDFVDLKVDKLLAYYGRTEPRDAVDLFFILQEQAAPDLLVLAAQKAPGFDVYWFAAALNRVQAFPDEAERWPVKMLVPFDPSTLKRRFQQLATDLLASGLRGQTGPT